MKRQINIERELKKRHQKYFREKESFLLHSKLYIGHLNHLVESIIKCQIALEKAQLKNNGQA